MPWFWYAFLGVFGFEVLLQNINVTFLNRGLLSISDWISKARDSTVAAALSAEANSGSKRAQLLANRLQNLDDADLNAQVLNLLGQSRLDELTRTANDMSANPKLTKALALAYEKYDKAKDIVC
jgi:hypothetical protein